MEDVNFNKNQNQKKKIWLYVFIPILILIGLVVYSNLQTPAIETLTITEDAQTFDINQEKTLSWTYAPEDADLSKLSATVSDETLAEINISDEGVLRLKTLSNEGSFHISLQSDDITSNTVTYTIVDKQKEAERIAAKKAEEERIAAEKAEQERIAAEKAEQERIAAEKAEQEQIAKQQAAAKQKSNSRTVYVTPTGKRYHYSGSCNGGSYSPSTLENALARGLTPCKKCVG